MTGTLRAMSEYPAGESSTMVWNCCASGFTTSASRRSGSRALRRLVSIRASAGDPVIRNRLSERSTRRTASAARTSLRRTSAIEGRASDGRTPSEIEAFRSASRSMSSTFRPMEARTAATFTAVVVFPQPPFGLNVAMITCERAWTDELEIYFNPIIAKAFSPKVRSALGEMRANDEPARGRSDVAERITRHQGQSGLFGWVQDPCVVRVHHFRAFDTVDERPVRRHEAHEIVLADFAEAAEERIPMRREPDVAGFAGQRRAADVTDRQA